MTTRQLDAFDALAAAVKANRPPEAAQILAQAPDLKARLDEPMPGGSFGATALMTAVNQGAREMIDVLLAAGADINARSHWWAGSFGVLDGDDRDLARFLIARGATVDVHAAARHAMMDRLRELVSANPDLVHARGGDGQTPLHVAASLEVAHYLVEHGADINARDVDHESTPAQYLIRKRQDVVRFLVSHGCETDLLMAAALGDPDLIRHHLDADPARIRMTVSGKWFPKQNPQSGGTIYIWTLGSNKTAHMVAREFGRGEAFELLMERTPPTLALAVAFRVDDEARARRLLAAEPDLIARLSDEERSAIVDAAEDDDAEAVSRMLVAGWPAGAAREGGVTALHWAGFHGNVAMTRALLQHHAPLDGRDREFGGMPLHWAIYGSLHGWRRPRADYGATVAALLDAGAPSPGSSADLEASEDVLEVLRRR